MTSNARRETFEEAFQRISDMDASLGEQLQAFADSVRQRRPEFAAAVDRLIERLRQNGAGETAPLAGDPMPPFYLPDETGHVITLEQLLVTGPLAVTFHRGHWCPYCRININALAQAHEDIRSQGGQIVAIMPDRQKFTEELKSNANVPFPILTDMDNGYAMSLNLAIWVGTELQQMMAARADIAAFQGNSSWVLPIPATFVVGQDGVIQARFVDPDYRKRMAIEDLLAALRK